MVHPMAWLIAQTASSGFSLDFSKIVPSIPFILGGMGETLRFTFLSALLGFLWGTILSLFKISGWRPLRIFADLYTSVFRGTPCCCNWLWYTMPHPN